MDCRPPGSSAHGILQARILNWSISSLIVDWRISIHFPLQGIFRTQGSNPSLLHCRQILYFLSHWGSLKQREFWPSVCNPANLSKYTFISSLLRARYPTYWAGGKKRKSSSTMGITASQVKEVSFNWPGARAPAAWVSRHYITDLGEWHRLWFQQLPT